MPQGTSSPIENAISPCLPHQERSFPELGHEEDFLHELRRAPPISSAALTPRAPRRRLYHKLDHPHILSCYGGFWAEVFPPSPREPLSYALQLTVNRWGSDAANLLHHLGVGG